MKTLSIVKIFSNGTFFLLFCIMFLLAKQTFSVERIFIEAESFQKLGGWVVDPHSMSQMGSSYIMAHGYGRPVANAETDIEIPTAGHYYVWVRTRDWTAIWKRGTPAGRFQLKINGNLLPEILGTNGTDWNWQKAGHIKLNCGKCNLQLQDMTGFNGRCDAIYLTTDFNEIPENEKAKLAEFRKRITSITLQDYPKQFDVIVVGGGISGICASEAAARTGSQVLLLQDREMLGGCNSSEIRVGLGGHINIAPYPKLGEVVREIQPIYGSGGTYPAEYYEDARKEILFRRPNSNCKLMLCEHVYGIEMDKKDQKKIHSVLSRNTHTGVETRFIAPIFIDATGDAVLARMANCEVMYGREARSQFNEINAPLKSDRQVMGHSVLWYARKQKEPVAFPDIDWAIPFDESNVYYIRGGDWEQEAGQYNDMANETEYIRDYGLLSIYSNWSYIKNHSKRKVDYAFDRIDWVSPIGGKRESYRVVGDYILTQNDLENQKPLPDQTAAITWDIDLHFPDPDNVAKFGEPFRSCAYHRGFGAPYPVPYRCLYARDCHNLFLAGRHISTSHVAFAAVRVMRTLGMLGEVVGMAASICREEHVLPRDIYEKHLDRLKSMMNNGVPPLPTYHAYDNGMVEKYHFKELGMINISNNPTQLTPRVKKAITDLGMIHRKEHPQLRKRNTLTTIKITNIFDYCANKEPKNDFELEQGSILFTGENLNLSQDIILNGSYNVVNVAKGPVTFYGMLSGTGATFVKSGKGTLVLENGLSFPNNTEVKEGTLQLNAQSTKTGIICVASNAILFCNARNALGIYAEEKTFPDSLIVHGTLKGPANEHVNLGNVILEGGNVISDNGRGSDILGNFCFAGKLTARNTNSITAQRISFRNDSNSVNGESGLFDIPSINDVLNITSELDTFHGNAILRKEGNGTLILSGRLLAPLPIEIHKGSLILENSINTGSITIAGSLILHKGDQKVNGNLTILPGGKIVIDANVLAKCSKENPAIKVIGNVVGDLNYEIVNNKDNIQFDRNHLNIIGK